MFSTAGSWGIFSIGVVGGFYFARFFDSQDRLSPGGFVSLLTVIGIGPTALVLIRGYLDVNLLDPYGIGVLTGVLANVILKLVANAVLSKTAKPATVPSEPGRRPDERWPINFMWEIPVNNPWASAGGMILLLTSSSTVLVGTEKKS